MRVQVQDCSYGFFFHMGFGVIGFLLQFNYKASSGWSGVKDVIRMLVVLKVGMCMFAVL